MLKTKDDVIRLIESDEHMMGIIQTANTLQLPDWWICAGFIRSKIWDTLHGFPMRTASPDVDLIYFDPNNTHEEIEKELEDKLKYRMPSIPWSVKNQARMHVINNLPPYTSSVDAICKFPETVTALGVKLDNENNVVLTAPYGLEDVINLEVKPTPYFSETMGLAAIYEQRIIKKNWKSIWPKLTIHHMF